ncbi:hypothetical protein [Limimonas halophila]|nr:hypothetical protein [Limimonas halophila]
MAWHARHEHGERREVVGFTYREALVRDCAPLPGEPPGHVPLPTWQGRLQGPTVSDVVVAEGDGTYRLCGWADLQASNGEIVTAHPDEEPTGPFRPGCVASGRPVARHGDFEIVERHGSVGVHPLTVRLASALFDSEREALAHIADLAAYAWEYELERRLRLYTAVRDGVPVEPALAAGDSISQQVENQVLREACTFLGVNPDGPADRPRDRAARPDAASGAIVRMALRDDGTVHGELLVGIAGYGAGTALHALTTGQLVDLLRAVRADGLQDDVDLLEAFLDAADPAWRERTHTADRRTTGKPDALPDPFEVLGLDPGTATIEDVKRAYRHAMKAAHPDTSGLPPWFAQTINHAYAAAASALDKDMR